MKYEELTQRHLLLSPFRTYVVEKRTKWKKRRTRARMQIGLPLAVAVCIFFFVLSRNLIRPLDDINFILCALNVGEGVCFVGFGNTVFHLSSAWQIHTICSLLSELWSQLENYSRIRFSCLDTISATSSNGNYLNYKGGE